MERVVFGRQSQERKKYLVINEKEHGTKQQKRTVAVRVENSEYITPNFTSLHLIIYKLKYTIRINLAYITEKAIEIYAKWQQQQQQQKIRRKERS